MEPPRDVTLDHLNALLQTVGSRLTAPTTLYLLGGSALRFLGSRRMTLDVDYFGTDRPDPSDPLAAVLQQVATEQGIEVEAVPLDQFMPLPSGAADRHRWIGQYGVLHVYVFDPYSIALSKLERGFETDLEDILFLLERQVVALSRLEAEVDVMLHQAGAFLIDPQAVRQNLAALHQLLDHHNPSGDTP